MVPTAQPAIELSATIEASRAQHAARAFPLLSVWPTQGPARPTTPGVARAPSPPLWRSGTMQWRQRVARSAANPAARPAAGILGHDRAISLARARAVRVHHNLRPARFDASGSGGIKCNTWPKTSSGVTLVQESAERAVTPAELSSEKRTVFLALRVTPTIPRYLTRYKL